MRHLWKQYFEHADAVIFLVDSADTSRFHEARDEIQGLLGCEALQGVPVAILANKIDLEVAAPKDVLVNALGISADIDGGRPVRLFPCSLFKNIGYEAALQWISSLI